MNEENMKNNITNLKRKFLKIKEMKYVKSINNNNSGMGLTFEKLLGKKIDNFPLPDYHNIEIKTKLAYSNSPITLFRLAPEGNSLFEVNRLVNNYGYYTKNSKEYKYLNGKVYAGIKSKLNYNYMFELRNNYDSNKLEMLIYNRSGKLIDSSTYWDFSKLENALFRKLQYLAIVVTYSTTIHNDRYYKYYKLKIYKLKTFMDFLKGIDCGLISVGFSVDVYKSGVKKGQPHDHGVCFQIDENNIYKIFKRL